MSKGHMQDLQGFRTISSPSASPVDAYGGGVNAPKVSAADQLASAFGTVSKYGQKAAAQAQVEDEKLRQAEAQAFINRWKAEEDGDTLNAIKAGELYPQVSQSFLAQAIEKKYNYETQTSYLEILSKLDDDIVLDDVKLNAFLGSEEDKLREKYKDNPFVLAGALQGFREAKSEKMPGIFGRQATATRDIDTTNINNFSILTLDKYNLETEEGFNSAVEAFAVDLDKSINTSINENSVVNQTYVDAIIKYATDNPLSGAHNLLKDKKLKYLYTNTTKAKLANFMQVLPALSQKALQNKAVIKAENDKRIIAKGRAMMQELALKEDRGGILKAIGNANSLRDTNPEVAIALFEAGEKLLNNTYILAESSKKAKQALDSDLVAMAIKGELDRESANMMIDGAEMRETEKDALRGNLDRILSGNDLIAASKHSTEYTQRVGKLATALDTALLTSTEGAFTGELLEPQVRDIWDDTVFDLIQNYTIENGKAPEGTDLRVEVYDKAEGITKARMDAFRGLTPPPQPAKEEPKPQPVASNAPQVGEVRTAADGTKATFLGGDPEDDNNYEIITGEPKPQEETSGTGLEEVIEQVMSTLTD